LGIVLLSTSDLYFASMTARQPPECHVMSGSMGSSVLSCGQTGQVMVLKAPAVTAEKHL
jgi:hypothetical protein